MKYGFETGVTASAKRALSYAAAAGLAGLAMAPVAHAEDAVMAAAVIAEVSGVQVTAGKEAASSPKLTQPLLDTPQTIAVVPAKVIRDQGATTLRDVLRNVPGISMQAGEGGTPNGDQLTLRGFSARTDILIDGVRDIGGYTRDSFNLEQVEVAKGPASAYSGRGSTGGSINQVSKTPQLRDFGAASLSAGTDNFLRGTLDVNEVLNADLGVAVRLNLLGHENDQPRRDAVYNRRWGLAPSFAVGLNTPTRITFSVFHLSQDNMPDYGIPWVPATNTALTAYRDKPAPVDLSNFYGIAARDFEEVATSVATLKVEHDFSDRTTLTNQLRYGETSRRSVVTAPRFNADGSTDVKPDPKVRNSVDSILTNQTNLTLRFATGPVSHTVATGVELTRERYTNRPFTVGAGTLVDLYDPDPYRAFTPITPVISPRARAQADTVSLYGFDTLQFSEQWMLSTGLRFDRMETEYDTGTADLGRTDEMTSGRVAVIYKPVPHASVYAGVATAFNPSAEGLTLSAATELLDPEETVSYEAGVKWELPDPRLTLSAAVFRTVKTNARTPGLPGDPLTVLEGEQQVDGLELGVVGFLAPRWTVSAAYTWMDGEVIASNTPAEVGKTTTNTPDSSFSLWTTYEIASLTFGGGASYVGERFANATNTRMAEGYWLADAMAGWRFTDTLSARLNIYNLADEEYFDSIGGGHLVPGLGRSAVVSLNYDF
jgi:catecholate siderophore receptor